MKLLVALGFSSLSLLSPRYFSFLIKVQCHYHWVMLKVGILKGGPGTASFMGVQPVQLRWGPHSKGPVFHLMLCCHGVETLNNLSLNLCVVNKVKWDNETWKRDKCNMKICKSALLLDILFAYNIGDDP